MSLCYTKTPKLREQHTAETESLLIPSCVRDRKRETDSSGSSETSLWGRGEIQRVNIPDVAVTTSHPQVAPPLPKYTIDLVI